jgi:hypothetical protein
MIARVAINYNVLGLSPKAEKNENAEWEKKKREKTPLCSMMTHNCMALTENYLSLSERAL